MRRQWSQCTCVALLLAFKLVVREFQTGEEDLCYPPLLHLTLHFLREKQKVKAHCMVFVLVPEDARAPWFGLLRHFKRVARYRAGSYLFRILSEVGVWSKLPATSLPWIVLQV